MYDKDKVYDIPLSEIFSDDEFNCRGFIDMLDVTELANDIKANGLASPITIQPLDSVEGKKFKIITGHRRYKAHQMNQAQSIRALIVEGLDEYSARLLNLSENVHRKDLNMKQEALALDPFRRANWPEDVVAKRLNKSRGWVQVRYMLLALPEDMQNEAAAGLLSQQQIRELWSLTTNEDLDNAYALIRSIKDSKIRKSSKEPVLAKSQKKPRQRDQIFLIQEAIRTVLGHSLTTRALAWAGGEISDYEMHQSIQDEAVKQGKFYFIPSEYAKESPEIVAEGFNE